MDLSRLGFATAALPAAVPARRCPVNATGLLTSCRVAWEQGATLVALWGSDDRDRDRGYTLDVVVRDADGLVMFEHTLPDGDSTYPDLSIVFPAANRMQRATFDLVGIASEAEDQRPWVWQASWPIDCYPASPRFRSAAEVAAGAGGVRVRPRRRRRRPRDSRRARPRRHHRAGSLPVPGRRRESAAPGRAPRLRAQGHRKAIRGDGRRHRPSPRGPRVAATAPSRTPWAYSQALEAITETPPPPRALWLRALALERERIANHLGDLGYLGNDGGFAFGLSQFSRLKEEVLRTNLALFGHRLAMDYVMPGGVARDFPPE